MKDILKILLLILFCIGLYWGIHFISHISAWLISFVAVIISFGSIIYGFLFWGRKKKKIDRELN